MSGGQDMSGNRLPTGVHIPPHLPKRLTRRRPGAPRPAPGSKLGWRFLRWLALAMVLYGVVAFGAGMLFDRTVWPWDEARWSILAGYFSLVFGLVIAWVLGFVGQIGGGVRSGYSRNAARQRGLDSDRDRDRDRSSGSSEKAGGGDGGEKSGGWFGSSSGSDGGSSSSSSSDSGSSSSSDSGSSSRD